MNFNLKSRHLSVPASLDQLDNQTGIDGFAELVSQLFGDSKGKFCPFCGLKVEEFEQTGYLGCALCYAAFDDSLEAAGFKSSANDPISP